MSLLLVFLTENYQTNHQNQCDDCKTITPSFGKTFLINDGWVCVDCVIDRIEGMKEPNWRLSAGKTET
jgi:hypothetical protein